MSYNQELDFGGRQHPSVILDADEVSLNTPGLVARRAADGLFAMATESQAQSANPRVAAALHALAVQLTVSPETTGPATQGRVELSGDWELCDGLSDSLVGVRLPSANSLSTLALREVTLPTTLGSSWQTLSIELAPPAGKQQDQPSRIKQLRRLAASGIAAAYVVPPYGEDLSAFIVPLVPHAAATFIFGGGERPIPEALTVTAY